MGKSKKEDREIKKACKGPGMSMTGLRSLRWEVVEVEEVEGLNDYNDNNNRLKDR